MFIGLQPSTGPGRCVPCAMMRVPCFPLHSTREGVVGCRLWAHFGFRGTPFVAVAPVSIPACVGDRRHPKTRLSICYLRMQAFSVFLKLTNNINPNAPAAVSTKTPHWGYFCNQSPRGRSLRHRTRRHGNMGIWKRRRWCEEERCRYCGSHTHLSITPSLASF